jgi:hypothetical protein
MSHSISKIVHVVNKQAAVDNTVTASTIALQTELAEINKALAASPSRPDVSILNARKVAINVALIDPERA